MSAGSHEIEELEGKVFPSAEVTQCPYDVYRALQEQAPVYRLPSGEYVISRYADIARVTRDFETFSSRHTVNEDGWLRAATLEDLKPDLPWWIASTDPPEHTAKRKVAFEMFKPGRLRRYEPVAAEFADSLIDQFSGRGQCEFVTEFADLLPAKVILTVFGLPQEHLARALTWARYEGFGTRFASRENQGAARQSLLDLAEFLREEILKRVDAPGEDELSLFVQRHVEAYGELRLAHLVAEASNLLVGGVITTTHLLSSMMRLFIANPEQQAKAATGRPALKRAVEETLRLESPVQFGPRMALRDTEIDGVKIPAGAIVLVLWAAANRDACEFSNPEEFDIDRQDLKKHMAFGNGPHFCMGGPLGRMEAVMAFERIFARMGNLRFAPDRNQFRIQDAVTFRGPQELFIEFEAIE